MSQEPPRKVQLSVIKSSEVQDSSNILTNPESLTEPQRELVYRLVKAAGRPGPVSGVIIGDALWDLRPVVVSDGVLSIIRFTDPGLSGNPGIWAEYKRYIEMLPETGLADSTGNDRTGQGDQWWIKRPFYRNTIAHEIPASMTIREIVTEIISQIKSLHSRGLVHGHISPSNVGVVSANQRAGKIKDYKVKLIDPGFCSYSPAARSRRIDIAPELRGGFRVSPATDIYGLGVVVKYLLQQQRVITTKEEEFLEKLLGEDPVRRPSLDWVKSSLFDSGGILAEEKIQPVKENLFDNWSRFVVWGLTAFVGVVVIYNLYIKVFNSTKSTRSDIPFETYWESGQPSAMREVAEAAVLESDKDARLAIIDSITQGREQRSVLSSVLKIGLDPKWEAELSDRDRDLLFRVALGPLLPRDKQDVDIRNIDHPAVALAVIGSLPIDTKNSPLKGYQISNLIGLPSPYSESFKKLSELGVNDAGDILSLATAHILLNDVSDQNLRLFLDPQNSNIPPLARISVIEYLWRNSEIIGDKIHEILVSSDPISQRALGWFRSDPAADWVGITKSDEMLISNGVIPEKVGGVQLVQLLSHPREDIRVSAGARLIADPVYKPIQNIIALLAASKTKLSISQTASLIGILKSKSADRVTLSNIWFRSNPPQETVIELLIARKNVPDNDPFNFAGAQYLSGLGDKVSLNLDQAKNFTSHSEPLVRALAYRRLRVEVPAERSILEVAILSEKDENLRKSLADRLGTEAP